MVYDAQICIGQVNYMDYLLHGYTIQCHVIAFISYEDSFILLITLVFQVLVSLHGIHFKDMANY